MRTKSTRFNGRLRAIHTNQRIVHRGRRTIHRCSQSLYT